MFDKPIWSVARSTITGTIMEWAACGLLLCGCLVGCQTPFHLPNLFGGEDRATIDDVHGPLERRLHAYKSEQASNSLEPIVGRPEYKKAMELFEAENYKEAEGAFKQIAKEYADTQIEEDALFMVAECQFHRERYSWAQDSYNRLMKKYPSTRYLDRATRRLFTIARIWLNFPEMVRQDDVQPVDLKNPRATPPPPSSDDLPHSIPIIPNLFDRTRPVFDTQGRALQALKSIWLNDPTGPLASDALMLTASYHLRKGDYQEANRIYDILRKEYPDSHHIQDALTLGSHTKLMSYQGPAYEGRTLDDARQMKKSILQMFPNHPDRERFIDELHKMELARAQREWERVEFYRRKNLPRSVAFHCIEIINKYPNSSFAKQAREVLQGLGPEYQDGSWIRQEITPPRRQPAEEDTTNTPSQTATPSESPSPGRVKL